MSREKDITTSRFPQHPTGPSSPSLVLGGGGPGVGPVLMEEPLLYSHVLGIHGVKKPFPQLGLASVLPFSQFVTM